MHTRVLKWGASRAIRLPKAAVASLRVQEGDTVELTIEGDAVILRTLAPRFSIEELVAQMRPQCPQFSTEPESLDDVSPPVGQELL